MATRKGRPRRPRHKHIPTLANCADATTHYFPKTEANIHITGMSCHRPMTQKEVGNRVAALSKGGYGYVAAVKGLCAVKTASYSNMCNQCIPMRWDLYSAV